MRNFLELYTSYENMYLGEVHGKFKDCVLRTLLLLNNHV